jgi:FtsH-binding integral membrane protein
MIMRIAFYVAEAMMLALVGCAALFVARSAMQRLGWTLKPRWPWVYACVWGLLVALGIAGGELRGPEFLFAYSLVGKMLLVAVVLWLASFPLSRYIRITPRPPAG